MACQRVLSEAGRARLHDIRAVLNSVGVSAEVLHLASASAEAGSAETAVQMLNTIRRELAAASADLSGLEALVTRTAHPPPDRWPEALEWALAITDPVARRCHVTVVPPAAVPPLAADEDSGLCLALVLIEAVCESPRDGRCVVSAAVEPAGLVVEWVAPSGATSDTLAPRLLAAVLGPRAQWSREGTHRRLNVTFAPEE